MKILTDKQCVLASYFLMFLFLIFVIPLHLLACFFAGFLIFDIIKSISKIIDRYTSSRMIKLASSIAIGLGITALLGFGLTSLISFVMYDLQGAGDSVFSAQIDQTLINIQEEISKYLPNYIPYDMTDIKHKLIAFSKDNVDTLRHTGSDILHNLATTVIGLIVGIMVSTYSAPQEPQPAFKSALLERINNLAVSFRNVVFAQFKISLINTVLFMVFVFAILPIFGVSLPFAKTLTILTFIFGLLPIVGNLLSNTLIVMSGLTISLPVATSCLVYLMVIHKLEYFINAQIIGTKINARSWEVLLAMLLFESVFGLGGLIAAPIFYAYIKLEFKNAELI